ncbi:hypothetical protein [Paenibacillus sp. CMAA1364]
MVKSKGKKPVQHNGEKIAKGMKIVTSQVCEVCKTPCVDGIRYRERMRVPGAIGKGIPCILTKWSK